MAASFARKFSEHSARKRRACHLESISPQGRLQRLSLSLSLFLSLSPWDSLSLHLSLSLSLSLWLTLSLSLLLSLRHKHEHNHTRALTHTRWVLTHTFATLMVNVTEIIAYNDLVLTSPLHSCLIISSHHALHHSATELHRAKELKLKKHNRADKV